MSGSHGPEIDELDGRLGDINYAGNVGCCVPLLAFVFFGTLFFPLKFGI